MAEFTQEQIEEFRQRIQQDYERELARTGLTREQLKYGGDEGFEIMSEEE